MSRKHDPHAETYRPTLLAAFYAMLLRRQGFDPDEVAELVRRRYPSVRITPLARPPAPPQTTTVAPAAAD
jgi:hypothetical protein